MLLKITQEEEELASSGHQKPFSKKSSIKLIPKIKPKLLKKGSMISSPRRKNRPSHRDSQTIEHQKKASSDGEAEAQE